MGRVLWGSGRCEFVSFYFKFYRKMLYYIKRRRKLGYILWREV